MRETCEILSKAHPHICALVDGDGAGGRYARELAEGDPPVRKVLQWPDGWTIEDVVGWIVEVDEGPVMDRLNREFVPALMDAADLVTRLKSDDRAQYGMKGDLVAYEIVANALTDSLPCLGRARATLQALAQHPRGSEHRISRRFRMGRFTPWCFGHDRGRVRGSCRHRKNPSSDGRARPGAAEKSSVRPRACLGPDLHAWREAAA